MKFDVYCDESRPDLFCSKSPRSKCVVIGSLWTHREDRDPLKAATNYVVIFMLTSQKTADFLTAYVADDPRTLEKIKKSPKWQPFT